MPGELVEELEALLEVALQRERVLLCEELADDVRVEDCCAASTILALLRLLPLMLGSEGFGRLKTRSAGQPRPIRVLLAMMMVLQVHLGSVAFPQDEPYEQAEQV